MTFRCGPASYNDRILYIEAEEVIKYLTVYNVCTEATN